MADAQPASQAEGETTYVPPATSDLKKTLPEGLVMIKAENVHVRYRVYMDVRRSLKAMVTHAGRGREFREIHAVQDISFEARAGEAIGVIGANGSGKSTLMRAIAGLLPVNEGAVYARATPMLLGVGAVLNRNLSGRKNILLGGLALGLTKAEVLEREQEVIDFAGIEEAIDLPMKTYSSGMSARLQFAISAAVRPDILIIDEALSVGDKDFRAKSNKKIAELRDAAGTVFLVTHSMNAVRNTCNRCIWLHQGKLLMDGEPEEVIDAYVSSDFRHRPLDPKRIERRKARAMKQKLKAERMLERLSEQEAKLQGTDQSD